MKPREFVWLNGKLAPLSRARVSVEDRGFLYGDGFFETLRAEEGRVHFLTEHLGRLKDSARAFGIPFPDLPWEALMSELLHANGLEEGLARVKILLSRGLAAGLGLPAAPRPTVVIWGRAYAPPSPLEYAAGWPVVTFPQGRTTFVGGHKSLNYLFYLAARQYALDRGAKEAVILEADGRISEGAATSLLYFRKGRYLTPDAASALPGVTLAVLARALARQGHEFRAAPTTPAQLAAADGLWLLNSLMGVMPAASLDGKALPVNPATPFLQEILAAESMVGPEAAKI
jgi:branched-chain amino acid aminotransferase/para-aminobenzoate synthetase component 1